MSHLMRPSCRLGLSTRASMLADRPCLPLHGRTVDLVESAERPGDGQALVERGASSTGAARSQEER
jgi:hypothetical protein